VSAAHRLIAVAGTHGKTTISTMIAHLLYGSRVGCVALLGGISGNYNTNYLHSAQWRYFVTEADEFDRSFLNLFPDTAVITSVDADHLDVYGDHNALKRSFGDFIRNLRPNGRLFVKKGLGLDMSAVHHSKIRHYGLSSGEWFADEVNIFPDHSVFTLVTPSGPVKDLVLGIPGHVNVENAVAASAVALTAGVSTGELRRGLETFKGIRRRFDVRFVSEQTVYIDDYAHHPNEIKALIDSVKDMYPGKKILGIFQPHLYSRTRDFSEEFARSLDMMDEVILLDIYPAREKPIEGVSSDLIFDRMNLGNKKRCNKEELLSILSGITPEVLLTIGAGDIDRLVQPVTQMLRKTLKSK
jgi:UDP-N-acetylmuramate--alanine ligase